MITFITGGQRSGKSTFLEKKLIDKKDVVYIATMKVEDEESKERVEKHKDRRPAVWRTEERYRNLCEAVGSEDYYIFECVGTFVSNIIFDKTKDFEDIDEDIIKEIEDECFFEMKELIDKIKSEDTNLFIISNEVGMSLTSTYKIGRIFQDTLGRLNQKLASLSDEAYFIVSGMEIKLK
jgi:adenosylcobinamide kinase/adenosylcobinamide-phosphate guanylyltransferase